MTFVLDSDGLLASESRAQLVVLRSLTNQYGTNSLAVAVHFRMSADPTLVSTAYANAISDLNAPLIRFDNREGASGVIRLFTEDGRLIREWHGFQNAATMGGAIRERLGAPQFSRMELGESAKEAQ